MVLPDRIELSRKQRALNGGSFMLKLRVAPQLLPHKIHSGEIFRFRCEIRARRHNPAQVELLLPVLVGLILAFRSILQQPSSRYPMRLECVEQSKTRLFDELLPLRRDP